MKNKKILPLIIFFGIAFGIPWIIWISMNILEVDEQTKVKLFYAGDFCSVGGLVAAYFANKKNGLKIMFKRLIEYRFPFKWLIITISIPFVYMAIAFILGSLYTIGEIGEIIPKKLLIIFTPAALAMFLTGPLGEEFGWRGFLLPKLLEKFNPLIASIILGFLWGIWHFPIYSNDIYSSFDTGFIFTTHTILASIIMTVIYLHTKGSILMMIIYHWLINVVQFAFMLTFASTNTTFDPFQNIGELIIIGILFVFYGKKMLKKTDSELLFIKQN